MLAHLLLALLLLSGAQAHTICQAGADGLEACTDGPDSGITIEVSGNAVGDGYQEHSLEAAGQLIEFTNDAYPSVEDWSFLLAVHGFAVPCPGLLRINGTEYSIFENGSIFERLV